MNNSTNYTRLLWFITSVLFLISFVVSAWASIFLGSGLWAAFTLMWGLFFIFTTALTQTKKKPTEESGAQK